MDTINVHGGNAGYHPVVYQLHLAALRKKKEIGDDVWETTLSEDKKPVTAEALKSSKQAYLACLFLLMSDDDRYSDVKATLDDNYLLGKQEYPQDLLAAKRLLADFKGTSKAKKRGSDDDAAGVAFAEKEAPWAPVCHGCGRRCPGGWRKCQHITEEHRQKVEELDAAGAFKRGGGGGANKRGTVNTAAGAEEDDATKEEDGEDEDNSSKLTSASGPLPTYRELLELTGHISTNVGLAAGANNEKYADEDSWDGDDLADLGVGFLEVGGATGDPALQDQGVTLAIKENWQVQGRKGPNPLKKSQKIKTPSHQLSKEVGHHPQEKPPWVLESCLKSKRRTGTPTIKEVKIKECLQEHS